MIEAANDNAGGTQTKLAEQLAAFYTHVNRKDHKPEPVTSSFRTAPANDNHITAKSEQLTTEKLLKTTPSVEAILRDMSGDWVWGAPEFGATNKDGTPVQLASTGPLKSIGNLQFSDGKQTEKAYMVGPDGDVIQYDRRMPRGAMLGTTESLVEDAGGSSASITIGNATFSKRFGLENHNYIPGRTRRKGKSYTSDESRALIAKAIANTAALPPVVVCPKGMAAGTAQFSDQFIGMKIGSTGKGGAPHWVDIFVAGEEQEAERKAHDAMTMEDKAVFAAAIGAKKLSDISPGGTDRGARKRGVRLLKAANDNFAGNLQKFGS